MKRYHHIHHVAATALAALLLTGCTQEDATQQAQLPTDGRIFFSATIDESTNVVTRGVANVEPIQLEGASEEMWLVPQVSSFKAQQNLTRAAKHQMGATDKMETFGVSAFKHEDGTDLTAVKPTFFYDLRAQRVGETDQYTISQPFYYPSDEEVLTFSAYYPADNDDVVLSDVNKFNQQTITYTVNADATKQADLMTTTTTVDRSFRSGNTSPAVSLAFKHRLAGVRFALGRQFPGGYIKAIKLVNVYTKGVYTIGTGWTEKSDKNTTGFEVSYNEGATLTKPVTGYSTAEAGEQVTDDEEVFLMIPHTFTAEDNAYIEVVYADNQKAEQTVSASLAGQEWKEGTTTTYILQSQKLTLLQIAEIKYPTSFTDCPKTDGEEGDQVGMYAVKDDGSTFDKTNIPVTFTDGKWVIDHTTAQGAVYKWPGYTYYFYYPYNSSATPANHPTAGKGADAAATEFFSALIDGWDVPANQSTTAANKAFKNADLQVALAAETGAASTISATMAHQVGLAVLTLYSESAIPVTQIFTNGSKTSTQGGTTSRSATDQFKDYFPYQDGSKYYFYTKAGKQYVFNSVTNDPNRWTENATYELAAGATSSKEVYSRRKGWEYVNAIWNFTKTEASTAASIRTFTTPVEGSYTFECWGAQGGRGTASISKWGVGGKGGYSKGNINLAASKTFFVYIGGKGADGVIGTSVAGGWNGGGSGDWDGDDDETGGGGGGATDIRITNGAWDNFTSLLSRIMVAGGGGGSAWDMNGGYGGGLQGGPGAKETGKDDINIHIGLPGTQDSGYKFGQGESGKRKYANSSVAGGGSGYWGATAPQGAESCEASASGGSGYVSGMEGCYAVKSSSTSSNVSMDKTTPNHYSGFVFTNASMTSGVNEGNGKACITLNRSE